MTKLVNQPHKHFVLPSTRQLLAMGNRPAQAIAHPTWSATRCRVLALATAGPRVVAVLGPSGCGKTMLLRDLLKTFGERGRPARLLAFGESPVAVETAAVLLVDEADRMDAKRLAGFCRGDALVVLAALPAFAEHLQRHDPDAAMVRLAALAPEAALAFVAERLAQLGLPITCLTEAAWAQLIKHGGGVPRLLIALLWLALLVAAEQHADRITDVHIKLAVGVRNGTAGETPPVPVPVEPAFAEAPTVEEAPRPAPSGETEASGDPAVRLRWRRPAAALATAGLAAVALLLPLGHSDEKALLPLGHSDEMALLPSGHSDEMALLPSGHSDEMAPLPSGHSDEMALLPSGHSDEQAPSASNEPPNAVGTSSPPAQTAQTEHADDVAAPASSASAQPVREEAMAVQNAPQNAAGADAVTSLGLQLPAPTVREQQDAAPPEPAPLPEPKAPAAGTTTDRPSGAPRHVVLIYPRGDAAAGKRGLEIARALRAEGFAVDDPVPITARKLKRDVLYYFAQDADAAADIERRLHGDYGGARLVMPRRHRPGTIEIAVGSE